jgi:hypothetical protein
MTVSIDAGKAFDKTQYSFMKLSKLGMKNNFLNLVKKILKTKNLQLITYLLISLKLSHKDQKQGKDVLSHYCFSTLCWMP